MKTSPNTPSAIIGDFLRHGTKALDLHYAENVSLETARDLLRALVPVNALAIVALMAELEQIAPDRARRVAERLGRAWDAGDDVWELLHEWHDQHARGIPVGFHPTATLGLEVRR
ncbi:hypothetical protein SAMN05216215_110717 [Saccharopolyspora shandongensis]|uniref:Uncharacterized protein n=1 Tax=Saccharopolyspora shandongensis TaxID=418495 RepID=A0A1H3U470_9PSEU|nr:hypothetical protein [Saccharopolyspora shandongensis]SDZ57266.1 hypothetical protein SAMN05216215_110717 [Saccharopolyspora shandongensis]